MVHINVIFILTETFDNMCEKLDNVLERRCEAELTIKKEMKNFTFAQKWIFVLGHLVIENGKIVFKKKRKKK